MKTAGAVLGPAVGALPVESGRVVMPPELRQQRLEGDRRGRRSPARPRRGRWTRCTPARRWGAPPGRPRSPRRRRPRRGWPGRTPPPPRSSRPRRRPGPAPRERRRERCPAWVVSFGVRPNMAAPLCVLWLGSDASVPLAVVAVRPPGPRRHSGSVGPDYPGWLRPPFRRHGRPGPARRPGGGAPRTPRPPRRPLRGSAPPRPGARPGRPAAPRHRHRSASGPALPPPPPPPPPGPAPTRPTPAASASGATPDLLVELGQLPGHGHRPGRPAGVGPGRPGWRPGGPAPRTAPWSGARRPGGQGRSGAPGPTGAGSPRSRIGRWGVRCPPARPAPPTVRAPR